ncbi:histidine kinase [uncultured Tenacibaculum sp.]|uniref:sensor histidine kinase n=1 Tax=uncultured Tenacibaculum sp. TaxID=174713 RepID=UPI002606339D|nr:histidine kinase [uncultured Tenacibaculum sp.]
METIKKHITEAIVHVLFWVLFCFISLFIFSEYYWSENPFLQYAFILVSIVYLNHFILLPFFVQKKWYFIYTILFVLISFFATQFYCNVFTACGCTVMKCLSNYLWQTIVPLIFFSFIWLLFKYLGKEDEIRKAKEEKAAMELKFLKSQINPHVLFNNLNTVYSYAIEKPEETPDLILKLSENLKHVLYESNSDYISMEKEMNYIDNYIEFQKIRTAGIKDVHYHKYVASFEYKIAPLLLITIIENAFKHSTPRSNITIDISVKDDILTCFCENKYNEASITQKDRIGLENLQKRLDLLYPNKHTITIEKSDTYIVTLKIELV